MTWIQLRKTLPRAQHYYLRKRRPCVISDYRLSLSANSSGVKLYSWVP